MPSLKSLRVLCDKMKNLSSTITICSISTGDLSFIVETDSIIVVSRYFNLKIDQASHCANTAQDNQNLEIKCRIDTKNLSTCFGSLQVTFSIHIFLSQNFIFQYNWKYNFLTLQFPTATMVGGILREKMFNIKINIRENVLLYFNIQSIENT